jgi:hypothetical protein
LNENYDSDDNEYSPDINFISEMNDILLLLMNISKTIDKDSDKIQVEVFSILFENISKKYKGNMIKTVATKSMKIINTEPYYINNIIV